MVDDVLEVWRAHEEIDTFLLKRLPEEGFAALTLLKNAQPSRGRPVANSSGLLMTDGQHRLLSPSFVILKS